jgi:Secretion system C-terminal sorting domain
MKKQLFLTTLSIFLALFNVIAQCDCNFIDPFGLGNACDAIKVDIIGPNPTIVNTNCSATYTINTPINCTGFAYQIIGGGGCRCSNGGCFTEGGALGSSSSFTLNISWDSPGTKTIRFFGYTGGTNGSFPNQLSFFGCLTVTVCNLPVAPNDIYISSPSNCTWQLLSNNASGATGYEWSGYGWFPTQAGPRLRSANYYLCVRATNSCGASPWYCENITVPTLPGCNGGYYLRSNNSGSTTVYPNPAQDRITVSLQDEGDYRVDLMNTLGQLVYSKPIIQGTSQEIGVENYPKGLYVVNIYQGSELIHNEKIIIQR